MSDTGEASRGEKPEGRAETSGMGAPGEMEAKGELRFAPLARRVGLPGYEIQQTLGDGGQALVFFGRQLSTGRRVAVKVLRDARTTSASDRDRLMREAEILAQLDHPYLAKILDQGQTPDGQLFLVMNFVAGQPIDVALGTRVESAHALRHTLRTYLKVLSGIEAMHVAGVVHRDLKPANILVDRSGEPRIIDFGLASGVDLLPMGPTRGRGLVGSLPWACPEQVRGQIDQLDSRSDLYSLGVVLYQLLTGRFPYDVDCALNQALRNIAETPAEPLSLPSPWWKPWQWGRGKGFDVELEAIIGRSLQKEPADRYQTAGAMAADLKRYLGE